MEGGYLDLTNFSEIQVMAFDDRALSALGINMQMKKIVCNNKPKFCIIISISNNELSDILYKNRF